MSPFAAAAGVSRARVLGKRCLSAAVGVHVCPSCEDLQAVEGIFDFFIDHQGNFILAPEQLCVVLLTLTENTTPAASERRFLRAASVSLMPTT